MPREPEKRKRNPKRPKRTPMSRISRLTSVLRKPIYLTVFAVTAIIYYMVFYYLIISSNYGIFLITIPTYMLYLLVITSALLLTVAVSSIHGHIKYARAISGSVSGSIIMLAGGTIASCACTVPIFISLLYVFGGTVADVTLLNFYISTYQIYLMAILILLNLGIIYHYLGKV